jgi:hypothetical protein
MPRRVIGRVCTVAVVAVFSVSLLASPAGAAGKGMSPASWLTEVCKTYSQMTKTVDTAGNTGQLAYANANQSDGAALQAIFQTRFEAQDQAVNGALAAVRKAGTPVLANGKQLRDAAVSILSEFHTNLQKALQQLPAVASNPSTASQLYATAYPTNSPTPGSLLQALVKANKAFSNAALSGRGAIYKATTTCR